MKQILLILSLLISTISYSQCENDLESPIYLDFNAEPTISCESEISTVFPSAIDNCDDDVDIEYYEEITYGECISNKDIFRVYRAFDNNGNSTVALQLIHIIDTIPPTFIGELFIELTPNQLIDIPFVTSIDNCSSVTLTYSDTQFSGGSIVRLYTATDECGNTSTFEQIISIQNNVTLCHRTGNGNWITITVSQSALQTHLNHGDTIGQCDGTQTNFFGPHNVNLIKNDSGRVKKVVIVK